MDKFKIKKAIELFFEAIGEDRARSGLIDTPERCIKACEELFSGYSKNIDKNLKFFDIDENHELNHVTRNDEKLIINDIPFFSMCEHHLLPFWGTVNITCTHGNTVLGLSKFSRIVNAFSRRLQIQERLTKQICYYLFKNIPKVKNIEVKIKAQHMCMIMRGIKNIDTSIETIAFYENIDKTI